MEKTITYMEENLGWETVDNGSIHTYKVTSKHNSFMKKPNIEMVVKFLKEHSVP